MSLRYPFSAISGQDELLQALLLTAVDPLIGGLLAFGDRGTGKSTAVRALAALLPEIRANPCAYHCDPDSPSAQCDACRKADTHKPRKMPIPVVDLPLGATEDRVLGSLNLERALSHGEKSFEPGLLAQANRGYLYIDEVNLLEDHIVDLLLDVAASGENVVEREGLSVRHPARIVLVGSGNPEEGELRPQLLDRFGLSVEVRTPTEVAAWVEIVKRRDAFERDPEGFTAQWARQEDQTRRRIVKARKALNGVEVPDSELERAATLCIHLKTDGLRGQLTLMRAARALAAFEGARRVTGDHLKRMAAPSLRHRLRRNPLDETGSTARITRAVTEVFGA
ncbi:magnesium chelatase ATPase subunit I [Aestuariivirga sp.]|uniref:magnesium chelatase ATPase subunit I n=1 Tax=Aestuariivirga sp. TaxID=2650926 RepID=UPI0025BCCCED|nr:magnesium chelatase ATPase subunit I [Aestuariivirga sp.]MCA3555524.1 magnesium chelatase ATPase subunit I [Aestuariivirga sp.]